MLYLLAILWCLIMAGVITFIARKEETGIFWGTFAVLLVCALPFARYFTIYWR